MYPAKTITAMRRDYVAGMGLTALGRKYGCHPGSTRVMFLRRGLKLRPVHPSLRHRRHGKKGKFLPEKPATAAEITEMIEAATRIVIPEPLRIQWKKWPLFCRRLLIARLRERIKGRFDRPERPFSANVTPFEYGTPEAHAIADRANKGKNSRSAGQKIKLASQGLIWDGRLWFWRGGAYFAGRVQLHWSIWEKEHGKPVPPSMAVRMRDGNPNNLDPANLYLFSRRDLGQENRAGYLARQRDEHVADTFFQMAAGSAALAGLPSKRKRKTA
jgi:hypothetical protein